MVECGGTFILIDDSLIVRKSIHRKLLINYQFLLIIISVRSCPVLKPMPPYFAPKCLTTLHGSVNKSKEIIIFKKNTVSTVYTPGTSGQS